MTDNEISKALALAIGWPANRMSAPQKCSVYLSDVAGGGWHLFQYTDPAVIWPIAERHDAFPYALRDNTGKCTGKWNVLTDKDHIADTAPKAVALAVIWMAAKKGKS